jgi:hypothetical protein
MKFLHLIKKIKRACGNIKEVKECAWLRTNGVKMNDSGLLHRILHWMWSVRERKKMHLDQVSKSKMSAARDLWNEEVCLPHGHSGDWEGMCVPGSSCALHH